MVVPYLGFPFHRLLIKLHMNFAIIAVFADMIKPNVSNETLINKFAVIA